MPGEVILVVDDEVAFREGLTAVLTNAGYRALSAADGREAVALIERHKNGIDLMVVDLCLPDMDGVEIIRAVTRRKMPIKIIAASGVFDETYLEIAKSIGAHESVRKPIADRAVPAGHWLQIVGRLLGESGEAAEKPSQRIVLLVDDESSIRGYVKTVLQQQGYQVLEAADGVDALTLFRKLGGAIDVLVTDIKMPRLDGIQLAKAVRLEDPNIPVVYISGERSHDDLHDPTSRIMLVVKPFLPQVLLQAVREVLRRTARVSSDNA